MLCMRPLCGRRNHLESDEAPSTHGSEQQMRNEGTGCHEAEIAWREIAEGLLNRCDRGGPRCPIYSDLTVRCRCMDVRRTSMAICINLELKRRSAQV